MKIELMTFWLQIKYSTTKLKRRKQMFRDTTPTSYCISRPATRQTSNSVPLNAVVDTGLWLTILNPKLCIEHGIPRSENPVNLVGRGEVEVLYYSKPRTLRTLDPNRKLTTTIAIASNAPFPCILVLRDLRLLLPEAILDLLRLTPTWWHSHATSNDHEPPPKEELLEISKGLVNKNTKPIIPHPEQKRLWNIL